MECPDCGAELIYHDFYGYYRAGQDCDKLGDIYKCPNYEGFSSEEEALDYQERTNTDEDLKVDVWEVIVCASEVHNGFFYTDKQGNLYEGYPC